MEKLKIALIDIIKHLQEDRFDNSEKQMFFEEGVRILALIKDMNS